MTSGKAYFLITLYRGLLFPLAFLLSLTVGSLISPKIRQGLWGRWKQRQGPSAKAPPQSLRFLIHAASGEFEYAKPLIRALKEVHPQCQITVTYFSPSFASSVHQFPQVDQAFYLPLDWPWSCSAFLDRVQPHLVLIARTDLWPEWLWQCRRRQIPTWVFSMTKKPVNPGSLSGRLRRWLRPLEAFPIRLLESVHCVSAEDEKELRTLGVDPLKIKVSGDTRYDQVLFRRKNPKSLKMELKPQDSVNRLVLVAGSTWPEDEEALLQAAESLLHQNKLRLLIAPHEPTPNHLGQLEALLKSRNLSFDHYSRCQGPWNSPVLLIDRVGVLADLYSWGQLSLVGGSFRSLVHSVMEPLASGRLTLVGPYNQNNREAQQFMHLALPNLGYRMVTQVQSATDLQQLLEDLIGRATDLRATQPLITEEIDRRGGASQALVQIISQNLQGTAGL